MGGPEPPASTVTSAASRFFKGAMSMAAKAIVRGIEYSLPDCVLTNEQLADQFQDWTAQKILEKTGISERHLASPTECASDLAVNACRKLFAAGHCSPNDIDFILFCTQSPDYFLPTTACVMQDRLGIPKSAGALDFNLGCSGFVYGLALAKGLVETDQAANVLLVTAETYSKFMHAEDKSVRTIFGDAGAATLVARSDSAATGLDPLGPFVFGTDGSGAQNLIVRAGAMRPAPDDPASPDLDGRPRTHANLYMNGAEIFTFTLQVIPAVVRDVLARANKCADDIDLFVFHQANRYMLEHLRKKLRIPEAKFYISMQYTGNTVSSTIPIALKNAVCDGTLKEGATVMLVGFGVGYSWGACLVRWVGA
jgi:3-oxoacyl-[acyl-carrier-protein] synthase-3